MILDCSVYCLFRNLILCRVTAVRQTQPQQRRLPSSWNQQESAPVTSQKIKHNSVKVTPASYVTWTCSAELEKTCGFKMFAKVVPCSSVLHHWRCCASLPPVWTHNVASYCVAPLLQSYCLYLQTCWDLSVWVDSGDVGLHNPQQK